MACDRRLGSRQARLVGGSPVVTSSGRGCLYISRRTVQTQLGRRFAELAIASRAQLAAQILRRQYEPPNSPSCADGRIHQMGDVSCFPRAAR